MDVVLKSPLNVGQAYAGHRIIYDVESGVVQGEQVNGQLKASGGDWLLRHPDNTFTLEVKVCLQTDDDALILMQWRGRLVIPEHLISQVTSPQLCEHVDKDQYYLRNLIMFETGDARYQWLNNRVAVAQGQLTAQGIKYYVAEVL